MYPGYGTGGVGREGYTGTHQIPSRDPNISHILALGPYLRPNEEEITVIYEVSEIWT